MSRDQLCEAAAALDALKQLLQELDARIKGPTGTSSNATGITSTFTSRQVPFVTPGLAYLRKRHFKRFPILDPDQRLIALPSMRSWVQPLSRLLGSSRRLCGSSRMSASDGCCPFAAHSSWLLRAFAQEKHFLSNQRLL